MLKDVKKEEIGEKQKGSNVQKREKRRNRRETKKKIC